jgi:preprotein translocase subunit YajC
MFDQILISNAVAQTSEASAGAPKDEFFIASFFPLIAIFAIFYFLIIRPQIKRMKETQAMIGALKVGDKVATSGGIVGVVKEMLEKENQLEVEIADGIRIKVLKQYVAELVEAKASKTK